MSQKSVHIYDPALCCSTGVCGPSVDPVLAQFAGTVQLLVQLGGIEIQRYNLGQQPQAFLDNGQVKALLGEGKEQLPYIFVNGELAFASRYPTREELLQSLGVATTTQAAQKGSCGSHGGCCS